MKKPNQVRKNGSAPRAARQAKTPPGKTVTVVFYCAQDDREMFRAEFPIVLMAAIKRASKRLRISLDQFLESALLKKLRNEGIHRKRQAVA